MMEPKIAHIDNPEVQTRISTRNGDVPWYADTIGSQLGPPARQLLEGYAQIPITEVEKHIHKIRDKAWQIHPYPCIGLFRFLDLSITLSPHYASLLRRLTTQNQTFLDLGCCFGQELRVLAAAGAPSERLYGVDLRPEFWELGYELFNDRETLKSRFIAADILAGSDSGTGWSRELGELEGKIDILYAGSFLHLFDYEEQVRVCERVVGLLRGEKGAVVLGKQLGNVVAGKKARVSNPGKSMFRHNEESFRDMWREVGEKTGSRWRVDVEMHEVKLASNSRWDPAMRLLRFAVFRE